MGRQTQILTLVTLPAAVIAAISLGIRCAASAEVKIGERYGGDLLTHVNQATYMMSTGKSYRVVGDQYSAAAMQVLFIESQYPDRVCATRNAKLHFHLGMDPQTGETMKEPNWVWTAFIRPENMKRLGKLPEFGKGYKTVRAIDYLGRCKSKTIACNVKGCGE